MIYVIRRRDDLVRCMDGYAVTVFGCEHSFIFDALLLHILSRTTNRTVSTTAIAINPRQISDNPKKVPKANLSYRQTKPQQTNSTMSTLAMGKSLIDPRYCCCGERHILWDVEGMRADCVFQPYL